MIGWFYLVASRRLSESQPLKFLYFRQNVFPAKSPFVKLSIRQTVRSTKCSFDKVSVDKMSVRQNVFRQNVFRQSVFRQNVRPPNVDWFRRMTHLQCSYPLIFSAIFLYALIASHYRLYLCLSSEFAC